MVLQEVRLIRRIEAFCNCSQQGWMSLKCHAFGVITQCALRRKITCWYQSHTQFNAPHSNGSTWIELLIIFYHNWFKTMQCWRDLLRNEVSIVVMTFNMRSIHFSQVALERFIDRKVTMGNSITHNSAHNIDAKLIIVNWLIMLALTLNFTYRRSFDSFPTTATMQLKCWNFFVHFIARVLTPFRGCKTSSDNYCFVTKTVASDLITPKAVALKIKILLKCKWSHRKKSRDLIEWHLDWVSMMCIDDCSWNAVSCFLLIEMTSLS